MHLLFLDDGSDYSFTFVLDDVELESGKDAAFYFASEGMEDMGFLDLVSHWGAGFLEPGCEVAVSEVGFDVVVGQRI